MPLRVAVYARGNSTPVLSLQVTHISYGQVPASVFTISPPSGAKVVGVSLPASTKHTAGKPKLGHLPFTPVAPSRLAGFSRTSMTRMGGGALVVYGRYLGGIVVLEQVARPGAVQLSAPRSGDQPGLNLPTVQLNGVSAEELDTALGTVIRFARGGVEFTVLGSVPKAVAEAAARGL